MAEQGWWLLEQLGTGVLCLAGVLLLVWITSLFEGGSWRRPRGPDGGDE